MTGTVLPVSEMLAHLAETSKALESKGGGFKCCAIILVDQNEAWAGAVGGQETIDLAKLLQTARDSIVAKENAFTVFYKHEAAPHGESVPINGHNAQEKTS